MRLTTSSNSLSKIVRQSLKQMLGTIRSECPDVDNRALRQELISQIKLALPIPRGPRMAPEVALALKLREENKPWPEIYAAVVDSRLERPIRQAVCAQLRHKVKLYLRRRRLKTKGKNGGAASSPFPLPSPDRGLWGAGDLISGHARELADPHGL